MDAHSSFELFFAGGLTLRLDGGAKTAHSDREGIYVLQPDAVNNKEYWLQLEDVNATEHAVWYDQIFQNWKIAPKDALDSSNSWIVSNVNNSKGPLEAATWKYRSNGVWNEANEEIILSAGNIFKIILILLWLLCQVLMTTSPTKLSISRHVIHNSHQKSLNWDYFAKSI